MTSRLFRSLGANKGIGHQIPKDLAKRGLIVLVGSRNPEKRETAAKRVDNDARYSV